MPSGHTRPPSSTAGRRTSRTAVAENAENPSLNSTVDCLKIVDTFRALSAGKDLARAHPTTPDRGVAHEERLQTCRRPSFQSSRRLGRRRLSGPDSRAKQNAVLHLECNGSRECRHLDSHAYESGDPS